MTGKSSHSFEEKKRILEEINNRLEHGASLEDACAQNGISRATYYNWKRELDTISSLPEDMPFPGRKVLPDEVEEKVPAETLETFIPSTKDINKVEPLEVPSEMEATETEHEITFLAPNTGTEIISGEEARSVAKALDRNITTRILETSKNLASAYYDIGSLLCEMRESKGYTLLGFNKWEEYLDSKREFGRSYLSYLLKLGSVDRLALAKYLDEMPATKLIEFVKRTDYPDKIPQLIEATWEEIKEKSVRETGKFLNQYIQAHQAEFREKKETKAGRKKLSRLERFKRELERIPEEERDEFVRDIVAFLKDN